MHFPHKFISFPRAFCLCWKKHDTQQGLAKKNWGIMEKTSSSASHPERRSCCLPSAVCCFGTGVKHQMQMAHSSTTAPECTKPSSNTRSAQHNVIKAFSLFFLNSPVTSRCLFSNNNAEFGLYCSCQKMDQNKWDLSPYDYLTTGQFNTSLWKDLAF